MNQAQTIDLFSQRLADAFTKARDELASSVERLVKGGAKPDAVVALLADPAFRAEIGLDRQTVGALFEDAATAILTAAPATGAITGEMLAALTTMGQESFLAQTDRYWATLQKELTNSVVSGTITDFRKAIAGIDGLRVDQIEAALNTSLNTYSATVGAEVARNDPPDAKYIYEGPQDDRTRDECVAMGAAGALTRDEIEAQFPGGFVDRGGYNCRHQWVPVRAASDTNTAKAKRMATQRRQEREARGRKWNPQTPRQAAEAGKGTPGSIRRKPVVDKDKLAGAFKEARSRKMNIDNALDLVAARVGANSDLVNKAYGALARKGITPASSGYLDKFLKELLGDG